jgi:hypothetical protein
VRLLLLPLVALCAHADSIAIEITSGRQATVHERDAEAGPAQFIFLASPCARIENIRTADGSTLNPQGSGPWITVAIPPVRAVDLSYQAVPTSASPRACDIPLLMPQHAITSISITITDRGSGLRRVSVPHLLEDSASQSWTATFPAVPSRLRLEWDTGGAPPPPLLAPTGLFVWNFWGLVVVLVTWTVAYLLWARLQPS